MADVWFKALFLDAPMIFGKRLLPFSLAHHFILRSFKNAYVCGGIPDDGDLLSAIHICSRTWEQNQKTVSGKDSTLVLRAWAWTCNRIGTATAHESFLTYLHDYQDVPDHAEIIDVPEIHEGETIVELKPCKVIAPNEYHLVHALMTKYGMTESEAWNLPINRAQCYYDTDKEACGESTLADDSDYSRQLDVLRGKANAAYLAGNLEEMKRQDEATEALVAKHRRGEI